MFERYTEAARRVIFYARAEANHRDDAAIGTRDILLGLIRETRTGLATMFPLQELAIDLRVRMGVPHYPITAHPFQRERDIPLDNDGKKTLAWAAREADRDRRCGIDCDHLMRGLLRFRNPASDALRECGIGLGRARAASRRYRLQNPSAAQPRWYWARHWMARNKYYLALFALMVAIGITRC